jgi:protein-disulfide isomerase
MTQLMHAVNTSDHIYGNKNAALELVGYGDYQCPYCVHVYWFLKGIQQQLGPDLKIVFRHFPLSKIHPLALPAAMAAEAAGLQDKFWEMHEIIFENQKSLDDECFFQFATSLELDLGRFKNDMQQKALNDKIERDLETGIQSGVHRTPTMFINGKKYIGDVEEKALFHYLKHLLTQTSITK